MYIYLTSCLFVRKSLVNSSHMETMYIPYTVRKYDVGIFTQIETCNFLTKHLIFIVLSTLCHEH